ncbi:MAG: peptidylprolyl isomerase [Rhodospirillales bacterium]
MRACAGRAAFLLGLGAIMAGTAVDAGPALAQQDLQRIAAIVNDDIISFFDLNARVQFMIATTGAPNSPETHKRFQQQVLKNLIDERLQKQEAAKNNVKVTEQEVKRSLDEVERQNNMPKGGLEAYLQSIKVPRSTLVTQVESNLAWQKLVQRKLRPRLDIGDDEIEETLKRIEANRSLPESHVAEIFLSVDAPDQEEEVLRNMERLIGEMEKGARFPALARQFSQSASAASGGDLGWVQQGQLDEQIEEVLKQMPVGAISKPIRTVGGWHMVALIERRRPGGAEPRVDMRQGLIPMPPRAPQAVVLEATDRAAAATRDVKDCNAFDEAIKSLPRGRANNLGMMQLRELPGPLQTIIEPMKPGQITQPLQVDVGTIMVVMVCGRDDGEPAPLPTRDDIRDRLVQQRLDVQSRRYMRDLRRAAFVDLRV